MGRKCDRAWRLPPHPPHGKPAYVPLAIRTTKGALTVTFIDPIAVKVKDCAMKVWSLQRTKNYGSKHHDKRAVDIRAAKFSADKRTVTLDIPDLLRRTPTN